MIEELVNEAKRIVGGTKSALLLLPLLYFFLAGCSSLLGLLNGQDPVLYTCGILTHIFLWYLVYVAYRQGEK